MILIARRMVRQFRCKRTGLLVTEWQELNGNVTIEIRS